MSTPTVVFDLDGTLIDTAPDLIRSTNHILESHGYPPVMDGFIRPVISFGTREMLRAGIKAHGENPEEARLDALFHQLLDHYAANIAVESQPFPALTDVLTALRNQGARLAVCTNKREDMTHILLKELQLADYFDAITGRDTFPVHKPDPEHLFGAIRLAGGDPANAVMVGDSETDVLAAKAAAVPVIGVTFGYTDKPITELGCDAVISHYDTFLETFEKVRRA
jgi:phosphoglycolate phosphatase